MICDVFSLQILPKLHFISTPWNEVHFTYCFPSQWVVGSNPGWCLKFFRVSQPVGRGFDPLLRHTFFCNKRIAENFPVLSGRLVEYTFSPNDGTTDRCALSSFHRSEKWNTKTLWRFAPWSFQFIREKICVEIGAFKTI